MCEETARQLAHEMAELWEVPVLPPTAGTWAAEVAAELAEAAAACGWETDEESSQTLIRASSLPVPGGSMPGICVQVTRSFDVSGAGGRCRVTVEPLW